MNASGERRERACARPSSRGAGLVLNKTSDPRPENAFLSEWIPIGGKDAGYESRLRRMRRSVYWAGLGNAERFCGLYGCRAWFVTLTYRPDVEWSGRHLSSALHAVRQWLKRHGGGGLRYVWVAELQKRGAVHYHAVVWLPTRLTMPKWDKQGWWPHGMTNVQMAGYTKVGHRWKKTIKGNGIGYLMKYVSKFSPFHEFPKGARIYGIGGLVPQAREIRSWKNLPRWCRDQYGVGEVARKACGLVVRATGEILVSPWVVMHGAGFLCLCLVGELPESKVDGPWSRWEPVGVAS